MIKQESMGVLDFLQDIAIIFFFLGSKITNNIGLVGAFLFCIYVILKLLINFNLITIAVAGV
jgi:hypothetical protein